MNTNLNNNQHNTVSNNTNVLQVPEDRSENSQNYFRVDTQPNVNTPQHAVPSQNRSKFSENSQNYFSVNTQPNVNTPQHAVPSLNRNELSENLQCLLTQFHSMEPKTQRPQKNGGVRRNIMRGRNNAQNWELQDVICGKHQGPINRTIGG